MKRICSLLAVAAGLAASQADAESWVFRRSYYSHDPVSHVRIGRQTAIGPIYTRPQGEYFTTGLRHLHSTITVGGQTFDHLNVWESWVQTGEQF